MKLRIVSVPAYPEAIELRWYTIEKLIMNKFFIPTWVTVKGPVTHDLHEAQARVSTLLAKARNSFIVHEVFET